jgi:sulfide:quinone oxidoreductase
MSNNSAKIDGELHDVVIVGGGSAGIAAASSLLKRRPDLDILVIEPQTKHYYQAGLTLVGAGVFRAASTERDEEGLIPRRARWLQGSVATFAPEANEVILDNGERIAYRMLVAAPGIKLDWGAIEGLPETLGKNGVTSNYRFDLAPYTWQLVQELRGGRALFTQPPMPIKCAGAPQKALYLSCDEWFRNGHLCPGADGIYQEIWRGTQLQ